MATGAAGDGLFRSLLEGCITAADTGIQRRPYHRNCGCALHNSAGHCPHRSRYDKISYPIRRSWSEGSLALIGQSSLSPSSSPAEMPRTPSQSALCRSAEDDEGYFGGRKQEYEDGARHSASHFPCDTSHLIFFLVMANYLYSKHYTYSIHLLF
ncbi:uncharacterized protein LOC130990084 [Salvia miltiorrhiza]|uniref:uncharacterized protein LOC130990084 n=1 Tax=Salvia miltiorrhiza TaxID=226208 RepID=UPI0025AB71D8|nr:uncharacterized protein LOC130990084 [Salvia miltiorrhiza]